VWTTNWASLGKPDDLLTPGRWPAVTRSPDGRLEIVVVGSVFWHNRQRHPGTWTGWHSLEKPPVHAAEIGGSALTRNKDDRLELFTKTSDGTLWHRRQAGPGQGPWKAWSALPAPGGGPPQRMAVGAHADGRLVMFNLVARTAQDAREVWLREQRPPDDEWSVSISFGRPAKMHPPELAGLANINFPTLATDSHGRLVLMSAAPGLVAGTSTMFFLRWRAGGARRPPLAASRDPS
jgi:hypothetical protein